MSGFNLKSIEPFYTLQLLPLFLAIFVWKSNKLRNKLKKFLYKLDYKKYPNGSLKGSKYTWWKRHKISIGISFVYFALTYYVAIQTHLEKQQQLQIPQAASGVALTAFSVSMIINILSVAKLYVGTYIKSQTQKEKLVKRNKKKLKKVLCDEKYKNDSPYIAAYNANYPTEIEKIAIPIMTVKSIFLIGVIAGYGSIYVFDAFMVNSFFVGLSEVMPIYIGWYLLIENILITIEDVYRLEFRVQSNIEII